MTYLHPSHSPLVFRLAIAFLMSTVVLSAFYLMIIYSRSVNLSKEIETKHLATKAIMIESAELQNKIFYQATDSFLRSEANTLGLVEEKNPTYFEIQKQWLLASQ